MNQPGPVRGILILALTCLALLAPRVQAQTTPAPISNLKAADVPWDDGTAIDLTWDAPADGAGEVDTYWIYEAVSKIGDFEIEPDFESIKDVVDAKTTSLHITGIKRNYTLVDIRQNFGKRLDFPKLLEQSRTGLFPQTAFPAGYKYRIIVHYKDKSKSEPVDLAEPIVTEMSMFDGGRRWLVLITVVFCGAVMFWILHARSGKPIKVRKIAGLEAVDEAVGRATEMGRSCLFVPGIQDINDIQTIAGMTILSRVSKTAAEFDAKIEVPTSKSLVMTTARETVQAAYLSAGRPEAYNQDLIYYVTDEQFGYVAYLQGIMVREKPAACFYMGAFFAESLILAETGNSVGAIQIAGTAMPAQLPFFVAACDYTLIGEEFFAAAAYLSGSPEELGSLKGQDVGKLIVATLMVIGIICATIFAITGWEAFDSIVNFLRNSVLS